MAAVFYVHFVCYAPSARDIRSHAPSPETPPSTPTSCSICTLSHICHMESKIFITAEPVDVPGEAGQGQCLILMQMYHELDD